MSARSFRHALAVIACTMALPCVMSGQTRAWDDYCTPGAFQACMSVEVSLVLVPWQPGDPFPGLFDNLTSVTVSIRNLQGTLGTNQAWGLQGLGLVPFLPDPAPRSSFVGSGVAPSFVGAAQNVNVPANRLSGLWEYGYTNAGFINRSTQIGDGAYPIAGCSALAPDVFGLYHFELGYFSTCGNGWVTYSWLMQPIEFSDATTVRITGYHLSTDGTVQSIGCTFNVDCFSIAPEPATILLVGTGLIAVAGLAYRRRRTAPN
jgi:PEP-CTERM motif-containing protein